MTGDRLAEQVRALRFYGIAEDGPGLWLPNRLTEQITIHSLLTPRDSVGSDYCVNSVVLFYLSVVENVLSRCSKSFHLLLHGVLECGLMCCIWIIGRIPRSYLLVQSAPSRRLVENPEGQLLVLLF